MNLTVKEVTPEELEQISKEYTFEESKEETVAKMFEMLKTTRAFYYHLTKMTYEEHDNGDETVTCFFKYKHSPSETVVINVTADSCAALISDVWKRLYEMI